MSKKLIVTAKLIIMVNTFKSVWNDKKVNLLKNN